MTVVSDLGRHPVSMEVRAWGSEHSPDTAVTAGTRAGESGEGTQTASPNHVDPLAGPSVRWGRPLSV